MQLDFDVAIVGSGPAGSASALRLRRMGHTVALIDRRTFPRHKLCGEYLNSGAVRELRDLGVHEDFERDALSLTGMRLHAHDDSAEFKFSAQAWSVPRLLLDDRLRARALGAGAKPLAASVYGIADGPAGVELSLRNDAQTFFVRARYAIGADGMQSTVARLLGLSRTVRSSRFAVGGHYGGARFSNFIEMYAGSPGYLAINPLNAQSANAVFVLPQDHLKRHRHHLGEELGRFSNSVSQGRRQFRDEQLEDRRHAVGPLAHATRAVICGNVLLAGDAAGFVDPFTGQGVYLALASAKLASAAVSRALRDELPALQAFDIYARELRKMTADRKRLAWLVRNVLMSRVLSRRAAHALRCHPQDYRDLVDAVSGNSMLAVPDLARGIARAFI